jgi:hypothetical protein
MAFTLNGFGTRYHGTRWEPEGTYITTKWFVFFYVPIIPLGSVRVLQAGPMHDAGIYARQSLNTQPVPLDKGMVLRIYGVILATILFLIYVIPMLNHWVERL